MTSFINSKPFQQNSGSQKKTNAHYNNEKNKDLFKEKREWQKSDLWNRIVKSSYKLKSSSGFSVPSYKEKEILEKIFPKGKFGNYVSREEFKKGLKILKTEEQKEKSYKDKERLRNLRTYLEEETGLKGKY